MFFETELKRTTHHAPECPSSQIVTSTQQTGNSVGLSIPNILNILTSAVGVSISLTTGAGGFSLAQNITWAATVDESLSPAFKLVRTLCALKTGLEPSLGPEHYEMIANSCVRRLQLCYAKHEASPADINKDGESVLDIFASRLSHLVGSTFLSLVTGFDKYPRKRKVLKEFPQISQYLGFNLLSVAILQEDEEEVEFLAMKYPSYGMEVNYCGQPPIHIAVLVVNLRILSLLTEQVNPEALNIADNIQRYPIDYAISHMHDKPNLSDQRPCVNIDEIHDEGSDVLQLLEDLATHFGDGYGSMATLQSFLQDVWLPRMEEVYQQINHHRLTKEELRAAQDYGVKLEIDEDEPFLWNDPPIGLKGWMRRLDEIATDPERPVVEASKSRIPNAPAQIESCDNSVHA
ncbi:hypothetical protein FOVG_14433 [Fusarium oxysporum f. sp. pisi HDV247]|uniref:Uncharacterized protein n=1 Tax=Fusarium oxysporum f. sp. pisi HDV247 TaxID=1080344 RepID=W9NNV2_FUSOX|nr:hypothetical protein FOVG_14433 [Fusarium oxysporum f. sp. pisi HDV247]